LYFCPWLSFAGATFSFSPFFTAYIFTRPIESVVEILPTSKSQSILHCLVMRPQLPSIRLIFNISAFSIHSSDWVGKTSWTRLEDDFASELAITILKGE
jgi:hypothetical protein